MAVTDSIRACVDCGASVEEVAGSGRPRRYCLTCRPRKRELTPRTPRARKTIEARCCTHCEMQFSGRHDQTYCSLACRVAARNGRRRGRPSKKRPRCIVCAGCGREAIRTVGSGRDAGKYCSRKCAAQHRSRVAYEVRSLHGMGERARRESSKQPAVVATEVAALRRIASYVERPRTFRTECRSCGASMVARRNGGLHRIHCTACTEEARRRHRRVAKSRRRALTRGLLAERIDPIRVFERDGWRCQLCQRKLIPDDRGTCKPLAPELDHIIPLSAGGTHTWGNVQCACRACNHAKGATPLGQLGLPMAA